MQETYHRPVALPNIPGINQAALQAQAQAQAQGIYGPLLEQIAAQYDREKQEAINRQAAFAQATDQAYQSARPKVEELWNNAIQQGTTLENAVSNRLKGVGESRSADFASKLAQIKAPTGPGVENVAGTYQGADASGFARGMNDVSRLIGRKAEGLNWIEKQPGLARQQSQSELNEALNELYKDFSDKRGETAAHIPEEIQNIYDKLYGRATEERNTKVDNAWAQVKFLEEQKQNLAEQKAAAMALGDKASARRFTAQQKALDRELQQWKAQLSSDTSLATNQNTVGATIRGQDVRADTAAANRAAAAKKKGKGNDTVQTPGSAKNARARTTAWNSVSNSGGGFNSDVLRKLKQHPNSADAIINTAINSALRSSKIDPKSPLGKSIRSEIRSRLGGRMWKSGEDTYTFEP